MRTQLLLPTVLLMGLATANCFAQIPNSGFETWVPYSNYIIPSGWQTTRDTVGGSYIPETRDTSHYPASVGSYSIRLENKPSLLPSYSALAIAETGPIIGAKPAFAITGHPASLTGYYKFAPLNGDTAWVAAVLTQGGSIVAQGQLFASVATNWTSFNIPISSYTTADSAFIILAAYKATSPGQVPHGNSVLNIDNLNFDNLLTGISEVAGTNQITIYPNPFSSATTLRTSEILKEATLTIYNSFGQAVKKTDHLTGQTIVLERDNLPNGLYFIQLKEENKIVAADKVVITDK